MASKVISFRLSDYEIEVLQSLQSPDDEESLNVTAARLLRGILGTSTEDNKPVDNIGIQEIIRREIENILGASEILNSANIQELIRQEVEKAIAPIKQEIEEQLIEGMDDEDSHWNTLNNRLTGVISSREEDKQRLAELEERLRDWMSQVTKWLAPETTSPPAQQKTKKGNQQSQIRI